MEDFINRTYTKKELSLMYFPESMPRTAVNHLMSWIRRCRPLWDELQQMGYDKTCKSFTPKQVKAIQKDHSKSSSLFPSHPFSCFSNVFHFSALP